MSPRPRALDDRWDAPGTRRPPTTIANPLGRIEIVAGEAVAPRAGARVETEGGIDLSPDGTEVAFAWERDGATEIYTAPLFGDRIIQLTGAGARSTHPRWSPDGHLVAFLRGGELWQVDRDGVRERAVSREHGLSFRDLDWSPDGERIAVADATGVVAVVAVATGDRRVVAQGSEPRWSPDGERILFARDGELYVVGAGGGDAKALGVRERAGGECSQARWSPDASMLAFTIAKDGRSAVAFAYLRDGEAPRVARLGATPFDDGGPVWRPDGRAIVYLRRQGETTHARRAFTISHADDAVLDVPGSVSSPRIGPDSETLVAVLADASGVDVVARPRGLVTLTRLTRG